MKTELTYLEARITEMVNAMQELKKDHQALQHAFIENRENIATERKEFEKQKSAFNGLQDENNNLKAENSRLQAMIDDGIQEIKNIIDLLPEIPEKQVKSAEKPENKVIILEQPTPEEAKPVTGMRMDTGTTGIETGTVPLTERPLL